MKVKKVRATYILIDLKNKPKWYFELNPAGTAPSLQAGSKVITDSYEIVQYVDDAHPEPSLKPQGNQEAEEVTGSIFGVFSAWAKASKEPGAQEAEEKFTAALKKIDEFMGQKGGPLLCGESWSVADCTLVPRLYHITTVAENFLKYDKHKTMKNLMAYMNYVFSTPEFKATDYKPEWILEGWAKYFQ